MKKWVATLAVCLVSSFGHAADNFLLEVNGEPHDIRIDTLKEITLADGTKLNIKLSMKNDIEYMRPYFNFTHSGVFRVTTTDLGDGLFQTLMISPSGTLILIQEHTDMDPTFMLDSMIEEITRPETEAGFDVAQTPITKKAGPKELAGKRVVTTNDEGASLTREIYAVGGNECGLLILTAIDLKSNADEQSLIDSFWEHLTITLP